MPNVLLLLNNGDGSVPLGLFDMIVEIDIPKSQNFLSIPFLVWDTQFDRYSLSSDTAIDFNSANYDFGTNDTALRDYMSVDNSGTLRYCLIEDYSATDTEHFLEHAYLAITNQKQAVEIVDLTGRYIFPRIVFTYTDHESANIKWSHLHKEINQPLLVRGRTNICNIEFRDIAHYPAVMDWGWDTSFTPARPYLGIRNTAGVLTPITNIPVKAVSGWFNKVTLLESEVEALYQGGALEVVGQQPRETMSGFAYYLWSNGMTVMSPIFLDTPLTVPEIQSGLATEANATDNLVTITDQITGVSFVLASIQSAVNGIVAGVWSHATRTMTSFGSLVSDIVTALTSLFNTVSSEATANKEEILESIEAIDITPTVVVSPTIYIAESEVEQSVLSCYSGQDNAFSITILDSDGETPTDLTGITMYLVVEEDYNNETTDLSLAEDLAGDSSGIVTGTLPEFSPSNTWRPCLSWALRDSTTHARIGSGTVVWKYIPKKDEP